MTWTYAVRKNSLAYELRAWVHITKATDMESKLLGCVLSKFRFG